MCMQVLGVQLGPHNINYMLCIAESILDDELTVGANFSQCPEQQPKNYSMMLSFSV